jgi:Zn-dependent M28 family amino/carboxypeptidase
MLKMPGKSYKGVLPPLSEEQKNLQVNLRKHVDVLAGEIGERNLWCYENLNKASDYIAKFWEQLKYNVAIQEYKALGKLSKNLEIVLPGKSQKIIVVGAHYDSVVNSPGANDNASGVAALLEISGLLKKQTLSKTIRLVAFTNEEPPIFLTGNMGSWHYAKRAKKLQADIDVMISLETIGYYSNQPKSQSYPFPFSFFYPDTANFIGFASNVQSGFQLRKIIGLFRKHIQFPSEGIAAPSIIPGISWSDQRSFWRAGYRAIMVTDTAFYRYPYYHTQEDTPDKLNYENFTRVVWGLASTIKTLAND